MSDILVIVLPEGAPPSTAQQQAFYWGTASDIQPALPQYETNVNVVIGSFASPPTPRAAINSFIFGGAADGQSAPIPGDGGARRNIVRLRFGRGNKW